MPAVDPPPAQWPTIPAMTADAAERFGSQPAIVDDGRSISYSALFDAARQFAASLVAAGIGQGDRVAIWAPNGAAWIISALGLFQAGAVLVPINTRFKGAEAAVILQRSGARALVTVTDFLGVDYVSMLRSAGYELPQLATIVVAHGPVPSDAQSWDSFFERGQAADRAEVDARRIGLAADDPSDILFTS